MKFEEEKKNEEVEVEKKKKIINRIINDLFEEDSSLYYASTIDIANVVRTKIETESYLNRADLDLVEGLSARDIQNLISYASNCC